MHRPDGSDHPAAAQPRRIGKPDCSIALEKVGMAMMPTGQPPEAVQVLSFSTSRTHRARLQQSCNQYFKLAIEAGAAALVPCA